MFSFRAAQLLKRSGPKFVAREAHHEAHVERKGLEGLVRHYLPEQHHVSGLM